MRFFLPTLAPLLLLLSTSARAQEPAYYQGSQAVRFEEAPDRYHYIVPCSSSAAFSPAMTAPAPGGPMDKAVCVLVVAGLFHVLEGNKLDGTKSVPGLLVLSARNIRFVPDSPQDSSLYFNFVPGQLNFTSGLPNRPFLILSNKQDSFFRLFLRTACVLCAPGATEDQASVTPQLASEIRLIGDLVNGFDDAAKNIYERAALIRVGVSPRNQPSLTDPPEAMALYSALNRKLMPLCTSAAQSCLQKYATYQSCKAGSLSAPCGEPPSCSTFCALSAQDFQSLHTPFCTAKTEDSMTLTPDWSEVVRKMEQARLAAASTAPRKIIMIKQDPPPPPPSPTAPARTSAAAPLDFMGKPSGPGCSVESSYATAMMVATMPRSPQVAGVPGMATITGQVSGTPAAVGMPAMPGGVPGRAEINGGIMAARIVSKTAPVYPPIARAAHVSGNVVMKAQISPEGDVTDLTILSGPEMLRSAARDAVKTWKYEPYLVAGKPVAVQTLITVDFNFGGVPALSQPATPPAPL